jgi:Flp pilus assembly protein TadB
MPEPVPPLVFAAEIVLVLALAAGAAALFLGVPLEPTRRRGRELIGPFLDRQRDLARSLGLRLRSWLLLRLLCTAAGVVAGALTGVPTLALGAAALGLFGLPWLLAGRAARRRLSMERALAGFVGEVRDLMRQSNLALDRALREAARGPAPELRHVLAPLAGDQPVAAGLAEVARRARSPLADMVVTALLIARTRDPMALVRVVDEVVRPLLHVSVEVQEENHATVAQQRAAALAIGVIMALLLAAVMRVPSMQAFYLSAPGQLVLLAVFAMYLGLVWAIGQVARPLRWVAWDIDALRRETEALVA